MVYENLVILKNLSNDTPQYVNNDLKIIDDDVDISKIRSLDGDQLDVLGEGEDAPVVAGIIDDRPLELRAAEEFTTAKWKVITQDDGFNSKVKIEEYRSNMKKQPETGLYFGKMYSDSEDEKKGDSPPRKPTATTEDEPKDARKASYSRSETKQTTHKSRAPSNDSDLSPPRQYESKLTQDIRKPTRHKASDSDISPPRIHESRSNDRRKPSRWNKNDERHSEHIESTHRNRREQDERNNDSDISPVRRKSHERYTRKESEQFSRSMQKPMAKKRQHDNSDSDLSPERNSIRRSGNNQNDSYSNRDTSRYCPSNDSRRHTTKDDYRCNRDKDFSYKHNDKNNERRIDRIDRHTNYRRNSDSPPPSNRKMARTLEGKKAGLQDARGLREENREFQRREDEMFKNMSAEASGRNAATVSRKREKRETSAEKEKKRIDQLKRKELEEKYRRWGKGLKQVETQERNVADYLHESAKPLARLLGDVDLEKNLREQERKGDPMLAYMKDKKRESKGTVAERPKYKGDFPPNRFNITPGYRWDGVDRSNGYERKYFEHRSKLKALQEEAYKWSTEDL